MNEMRQTNSQHSGPQPEPGTPIIVRVSADLVKGEVVFSHDWQFENGASQGGGDIHVPPRKNPDSATPIRFLVKDTSGRHLNYDPSDPIWISREACPMEASQDPEIPTESIKIVGQTLHVIDQNTDACTLHYTLRFRDRDGTSEHYDPAIRNGGLS